MSDLLITIGIILGFCGIIAAFGFGYLLNPYARVRLRRQFMHQDFGIAKVLSKDGRALQTKIINLEEDSFELGGMIWFSKKGFVYREHFETDGFIFKKVAKHTEEGFPTIYLPSTSLKPMSLHVPETKQTPGEMSAWMRTNAQIQVAKGLVGDKKQQQMAMATLALCGIIIIGLFITYSAAQAAVDTSELAVANTEEIKMMFEAVHGVSIQNGSIVFGAPNAG